MIEFKNVEIKYGDFTAFENLNLTVGDGEFFTFLGPSGCGKTTALRALVGFLTPTAGEIKLDGKDLIQVPVEKRGIGMVFQSYALFPTMTVYENLAFGLKVKKMSASEIDKKVREVAKSLNLEDLLDRKPRQLSGGQRQRVALGRAIVRNPKVFLMDEPLSNLDANLRVQMRSEIKRLHNKLQTTFIYVTHDQTEALTMGDRIVVLDKGKIQQAASPDEIYNNPKNKFVAGFIGQMNFIGVEIKDGHFEIEGVNFKAPQGITGSVIAAIIPFGDAMFLPAMSKAVP